MEPNETLEENFDIDTESDLLSEDIAEEEPDNSEDISSITGEQQKPAAEPEAQGTSEPGYVKRRVEKAVARAVAENNAAWQAKFDAAIKPLQEKQLESEARDLVKQGEFKSIERAKEYLQLKQGLTPAAPEPMQEAQPRNEKGQYSPKEDPVISARIDILTHQADRIKEETGIDVMAEFNSNAEIKQAVLSGDMDFYDVKKRIEGASQRRRPPAPTRSPNGASGSQYNALNNMTDEQFEQMEKRISQGARYTLK